MQLRAADGFTQLVAHLFAHVPLAGRMWPSPKVVIMREESKVWRGIQVTSVGSRGGLIGRPPGGVA